MLTTLFDWFEQRDGQIVAESSGMGALSRPEDLLVGDGIVAGGTSLSLFVFVDLAAFHGKKALADSLATSTMWGAGLKT